MQYHSKATDTVQSIKLRVFIYKNNFQAECVPMYMLLFYQISAWVFLIHMFLYAGFYCSKINTTIIFESPTLKDLLRLSCGLHVGLDILTAIYFRIRKSRDKLFLNSNELYTFFFKQWTLFFLITLPSLNKFAAFL